MEKLTRRSILFSWIVAAAAVAIGAGWRVGWGNTVPPQIPLFYSKPWGDEQLATPDWMWAPIGMTVFIAFAASMLSKHLKRYPVLQATVIFAALICQIILITAIIRIIILVM